MNGKRWLTGASILLAIAMLAACGGGGGEGSTAAPPPDNSAPPPDNVAGFAYVWNNSSANISAYEIDAGTGALSDVAGSPFAAGTPNTSFFLTVDPLGKFAYVTNLRTVSAYAINASTGALQEIAGSPFAVGPAVAADQAGVRVSVEPSGRFAYVVSGGDSIWAYAFNATTGALSGIAGSPFATGAGSNPNHVTFDPLGRFAYAVHLGGATSLLAYTIDGATGALSEIAGSPFAVTAFPNAFGLDVSFDPLGRFAYAVNRTEPNYITSSIAAYTINAGTGALSEIAGSPFATMRAPEAATVDPSGRFAYVANRFSANLSAFTIDAGTGVLSEVSGSPFAAGTLPAPVTVDPSGRFAYVANTGSGNVSAYTINASTGVLSDVAGSPFAAGTNPSPVRVDPSGRFAYVTNTGSGNVSAYTINASTGALSAVAGSPFPAGSSPVNLTFARITR